MAGSLRRAAGLVIAVLAMTGACAGTAAASAPRASVGSVPALPGAASVTGTVDRAHRVQLTLSLASRDPLAMQRMATAVSTPGTGVFRHYLTTAQFARRFGATPAHIAAVTRSLKAAGLKVGNIGANRMTLNVSGTAGQVEHAFDTRLASVRLPSGRRAFANRTTPTLPVAIAGDVDSVVGLQTLSRPQPAQVQRRAPATYGIAHHSLGHVATGGPQPCGDVETAATIIGGYTADQIASAYNFAGFYNAADQGQGQTIAVFELQQLKPSDVATFQDCYRTAAPVSFVKVGKPGKLSDDEEAALDVEQIIGLAPQASVIVYEAGDTNVAGVRDYSKIINQNKARTISVSWGSCEPKITLGGTDTSIVDQENKLFQQAALQGQSILAASGDTGSAACFRDLGSRALSVQDPASQPYATGVGGTSLYTESNGSPALWNPAIPTDPLLESVWNGGQQQNGITKEPAGTTGGLSNVWSMPKYQRAADPGLAVVNSDSSGKPCKSNGNCREVPDVSADGDPATGYLVYVTAPDPSTGTNVGQWTVEGGTSAAAPLWAALTADANALPGCRGASLGFENPALYTAAAAQPGDIKDITTASPEEPTQPNNDAAGANAGKYPVTTGYDMATGLGAPNAAAIGAELCALRAPVFTVSVLAPKHPRAIFRHRTKITVSGTDSGKRPLSYSAKGLPKGLKISAGGVITGQAKKSGTFTVTVTATDNATNVGTTQFVLKVVTPPATISHTRLSGVAGRHPVLSFSVVRGRFAAKLHAITLRLPPGLKFGKSGHGIQAENGPHEAHFKVTHLKDGIEIVLEKSQKKLRLIVKGPTLLVTRKFAKQARQHKVKVHVHINVTDGHRRTTRRSIRLRVKR